MEKTAKYVIVAREAKVTNKFYSANFRTAKRHGKFIFKFGTARSVCVVNMAGKVGLYLVVGQPEKTEEVKSAKTL